MSVTIDLPEEIEHHLDAEWGDLPRRALEALAVEGYRAEALSAGQVAQMNARVKPSGRPTRSSTESSRRASRGKRRRADEDVGE